MAVPVSGPVALRRIIAHAFDGGALLGLGPGAQLQFLKLGGVNLRRVGVAGHLAKVAGQRVFLA